MGGPIKQLTFLHKDISSHAWSLCHLAIRKMKVVLPAHQNSTEYVKQTAVQNTKMQICNATKDSKKLEGQRVQGQRFYCSLLLERNGEL